MMRRRLFQQGNTSVLANATTLVYTDALDFESFHISTPPGVRDEVSVGLPTECGATLVHHSDATPQARTSRFKRKARETALVSSSERSSLTSTNISTTSVGTQPGVTCESADTQTAFTLPNHVLVQWHCNAPATKSIVDMSKDQIS